VTETELKILISRPDKIGDVVLALHGAKQLKKILPHSKIYLHVSEYTLPLVKNITFIDGCVQVGEDISQLKIDIVVDLMAKFKIARQYVAPPIPVKIGNAARWFSFIYNKSKILRRSYAKMNEAEYNWSLMQLVDPSLASVPLTETVTINDFKSITEFKHSKPYIVLMPGVSVSATPWPSSGWIDLAKEISRNEAYDVLFIGGPAEKDLLKEILDQLKDISNIKNLQISEFETLLGVLKNASGYVGPSTGVTHLASVAGVPGIALYPDLKSMHPKRWQPFRSSLRILTINKDLTSQTVCQALNHELSKDRSLQRSTRYREPLSAFIICYNEEENIARALKSILWCDEITVIDSGSTDRTLEICKTFTNVKIVSRPWPGHVAQKQFALTQCSHEWILNIDSDEEVSDELRANIEEVMLDSTPFQTKYAGYRVSRVVRFLDRWWDKGGWYPEYRLRLLRNNLASWGGLDPHEKALVKGPVRNLSGALYHYTYHDITDQIDRVNKFSLNSARSLLAQGKNFWFLNLFLNPLFRFFKFYFLKKGFLEGRAGFIVAINESIATYLKYVKLWELEEDQPKIVAETLPDCKFTK